MVVLRLMAEGLSNAGIAKRLNLSPKTVENYVNHIYSALNLTGAAASSIRVKAVLWYQAQQKEE